MRVTKWLLKKRPGRESDCTATYCCYMKSDETLKVISMAYVTLSLALGAWFML